jgi:hypothetical protein
MDTNKPNKEIPTQLRVIDVSTPEEPSKYLEEHGMQDDPSFTADLGKVYRISWKTEGGFLWRGLRTERFHEIVVLGAEECEVRTWELMGGILAHTVKWIYQEALKKWYGVWCEQLKKESEKQWQERDKEIGG